MLTLDLSVEQILGTAHSAAEAVARCAALIDTDAGVLAEHVRLVSTTGGGACAGDSATHQTARQIANWQAGNTGWEAVGIGTPLPIALPVSVVYHTAHSTQHDRFDRAVCIACPHA